MAYKMIIAVFMLSISAWYVEAAVNCTAAGRFPEPTDTTCKNYTYCVSSGSGTFTPYNYTCPSISIFNPTTQQCTDPNNYECTVNNNTTETENSTSLCTVDGYIADPSSTNCSSYIQCILIDGNFTETTMSCPDGTFYNPNSTFCEPDYNCTSTDDTSAFSCNATGRFANTEDSTCKTYFYCVKLSTGAYTQYNYTCPSTSVFNPESAVCTTSYNCIIQAVVS